MTEWKDEETLRNLYHHKGLSTWKIADRLGCSQSTVTYWMDKFDIKTRNGSDAAKLDQRRNPANFRTYMHGYERWTNEIDGEKERVRVHRLLAVAKYGFERVCGMDVHHCNNIPWDNRMENIGLMDHTEHSKHHTPEGLNPRERWKNAP